MKRLNNKGFAVASILYSIMVLFLMLLLSILGILGSRKAILDKNKKDILNDLNWKYQNNKFIFNHRNITIINRGNRDDIVFALMDGVSAIDENGNEIDKGAITYDLNVDEIENKDYTITYTANNNGKQIVGTRKVTFSGTDIKKDFGYTGGEQPYTITQNGLYKLEVWGAQGGRGSLSNGGLGGYSVGSIILANTTQLYINVGGQGVSGTSTYGSGGYNGGGNVKHGLSGGGATHIALVSGTIKNIGYDSFVSNNKGLIVAGGGGGRDTSGGQGVAGSGGGYIGGSGFIGNTLNTTGGTQTSVGDNKVIANTLVEGGFGFGAGDTRDDSGGAGGGGLYGGGVSIGAGPGAGGSGYIANPSLKNKVMYCYNCEQSIEPSTYTITTECASNDPIEKCAKQGNGHAKISLIYYY